MRMIDDVATGRSSRRARVGRSLLMVVLAGAATLVLAAPSTAAAWVRALGAALGSSGGLLVIAGLLLALVAGYQVVPVVRAWRERHRPE